MAAESPIVRAPIEMGERGLQLRTFDDLWRFSQAVAASGLAPKDMKTPEAIMIAVQFGAELGIPPMQALQSIAVINGRPMVWGDTALGICRASGLFDEGAYQETLANTDKGDACAGVCQVRRLPNGAPVVRSFSVTDAKRAGLWAKQGPWTQYPQRMLCLRARGWALRDAFSDVLRGVAVGTEAGDVIDAEAEPANGNAKTRAEALVAKLTGQLPALPETNGRKANGAPVRDSATDGAPAPAPAADCPAPEDAGMPTRAEMMAIALAEACDVDVPTATAKIEESAMRLFHGPLASLNDAQMHNLEDLVRRGAIKCAAPKK